MRRIVPPSRLSRNGCWFIGLEILTYAAAVAMVAGRIGPSSSWRKGGRPNNNTKSLVCYLQVLALENINIHTLAGLAIVSPAQTIMETLFLTLRPLPRLRWLWLRLLRVEENRITGDLHALVRSQSRQSVFFLQKLVVLRIGNLPVYADPLPYGYRASVHDIDMTAAPGTVSVPDAAVSSAVRRCASDRRHHPPRITLPSAVTFHALRTLSLSGTRLDSQLLQALARGDLSDCKPCLWTTTAWKA